MESTDYRAGTYQTAPPVPADADFFGFPTTVSDYTVAANSEGIWYLPRKGEPKFTAWGNVASVSSSDVAQALVITDVLGGKITLGYGLEHFEQLRDMVLASTEALRVRVSSTKVFHRRPGNIVVALGCFIFLFSFAYYEARRGQPIEPVLFIGLACLALIGLVSTAQSVEISGTAVTIKYLGWQRTIPFDTISYVALSNLRVHSRYASYDLATVMIERPNRRPIKLTGFREGPIALHDALYSAWRAARGGQRP